MRIDIPQESTIENMFSTFLEDEWIFSIPLYQREYSWRESNWEELYKDLKHSYTRRMETNYWGSILIYKNNIQKEYEIVDGQQRIVSILLLTLALGEIYNIGDKLPLKFPDVYNSVWVKIAQNQRLTQDEKRSPLQQAKKYFNILITGDDLRQEEFLNHLKRTKFSIVVIDDELESNLLFGRLNTRGVALDDIDLIKHKVFYETDRNLGPTQNDLILDEWKTLYKITANFNTSLKKFVFAWWENRYATEKNLYDSFLEELNPEGYQNFLINMNLTAKGVCNWRNNTSTSGSDNKIGRNLTWLLKISSSDKVLNIIQALFDVPFSENWKMKIMEIITMYEFSREIMSGADFSSIDSNYTNFGNSILKTNTTENDIKNEILGLIDAIRGIFPAKEEFISSFSDLRFDDVGEESRNHEKMLSRYAIYTLNNVLDTSNHGAGVTYRMKDDDEYSIEHIRAKSNAEQYNENSIEFKIGNLVVFEKQPNNDLGNIDVACKISEYKKSSYPQMKELLFKTYRKYAPETRKKNQWEWDINNFNEDSINARGKYLANFFYEHLETLLTELYNKIR